MADTVLCFIATGSVCCAPVCVTSVLRTINIYVFSLALNLPQKPFWTPFCSAVAVTKYDVTIYYRPVSHSGHNSRLGLNRFIFIYFYEIGDRFVVRTTLKSWPNTDRKKFTLVFIANKMNDDNPYSYNYFYYLT